MTNEQYKELNKRIDSISIYLKIEEKRQQLKEEELRTQDPNFWEDPKKAEVQMKVIRGLKFWVEQFDSLKSGAADLDVLQDAYHFCRSKPYRMSHRQQNRVEGRTVTVQNPTGQAEPTYITQISSSLQNALCEQHSVPVGYATAAVKVTK